MAEEEKQIEKLKKNYRELAKKYNLPEFEKLAEDFDIENIEKGSSFVLRDVRRAINEKLSAYLHLFEMFLNPGNSPMFIFSMLKNVGDSDKKEIKEIYKILVKSTAEVMKLDTIYNEKKEAEFISNTSKEWNELKHKILELFKRFDNIDLNNNISSNGYFG